MTPMTQAWHKVATLEDLWEGEMMAVAVDDTDVLLLNIEGRVFAYENRCPHSGSRLSEGQLDGPFLTCSSHEWVFDCRFGQGVNPASACLRQFDVRVDSDWVFISLEDE